MQERLTTYTNSLASHTPHAKGVACETMFADGGRGWNYELEWGVTALSIRSLFVTKLGEC